MIKKKISKIFILELAAAIVSMDVDKVARWPEVELTDDCICSKCGGTKNWKHIKEDDGPGTAIIWICHKCGHRSSCLAMGIAKYVAAYERKHGMDNYAKHVELEQQC